MVIQLVVMIETIADNPIIGTFTIAERVDIKENYEYGVIDAGGDNDGIQHAVGQPRKSRVICIAALSVAAIILLAAVITLSVVFANYLKRHKPQSISAPIPLSSNITVYYAASLKSIMTEVINPTYTSTYNIGVKTVADASGTLAKSLKAGAIADILITADGKISASLLQATISGTNRPVTTWYTNWAETELGIAYNTQSTFADQFESIANNSRLWYEVLDPTKMRIGRTNPDLDPKGKQIKRVLPHFSKLFLQTPAIKP